MIQKINLEQLENSHQKQVVKLKAIMQAKVQLKILQVEILEIENGTSYLLNLLINSKFIKSLSRVAIIQFALL